MRSRSDLRRELDDIARQVDAETAAPMVAKFTQSGANGEARPPGLYRGRTWCLVGAGPHPGDAELRRHFPNGDVPLFIGGEADPALL